MKSRIAVIALSLLLLLVASFASSAAGWSGWSSSSSAPNTSLVTSGAVMNAGNQMYFQQGGSLIGGTILGYVMNPTSTTIQYSMVAQVSGESVSGVSTLTLHGTTIDGYNVSVSSQETIGGAVPAAEFPLGCTSGVNCASEIPAMFLGESQVQVTIGSNTQSLVLPIAIESGYMSPFGGPTVIASSDGEINLVATYNIGMIFWNNAQLAGVVQGMSGSNPVSGNFAMGVSSFENLVAGTEFDYGSITFSGMSQSNLNMVGYFHGQSTIPTIGAESCAAQMGTPDGTCSMTGLTSSGSVSFYHNGMSGTYLTQWATPAVAFESQVSISGTSSY